MVWMKNSKLRFIVILVTISLLGYIFWFFMFSQFAEQMTCIDAGLIWNDVEQICTGENSPK